MKFEVEAIGVVRGAREKAEDDYWGGARSCIELVDGFDESALDGIEAFSHVEILFLFDRVEPESVVSGARHPRNNHVWPAIGIFAQRGKKRPNRIGSTICQVIGREGNRLDVAEFDAIEGSPVLDIKPVMQEFLPRTEVHQPDWSRELMRAYWLPKRNSAKR